MQAAMIATMFDEKNIEEETDESDEDTTAWKSLVPEWLHEYDTVFSKKK